MNYSWENVFPVKLYTGTIQNCGSVLNEIKSKESEISAVSEATQLKDVDQYATDYDNPVRIHSFEKEIEGFFNGLVREYGFQTIVMRNYWTAIYRGPYGVHAPHIHRHTITDPVNYSGVLYLSNHDGTHFYRPHAACHETQLYVPAVMGNIVLFPSELVHAYTPKTVAVKNNRYIMSFNLHISG